MRVRYLILALLPLIGCEEKSSVETLVSTEPRCVVEDVRFEAVTASIKATQGQIGELTVRGRIVCTTGETATPIKYASVLVKWPAQNNLMEISSFDTGTFELTRKTPISPLKGGQVSLAIERQHGKAGAYTSYPITGP